MTEPVQPIIQIQNVSRRYPNQESSALNSVSLSIQPGEFIALMGPSGCGKSTLLNLLGGMDLPTSGTIEIDGKTLSQQSDQELTEFRKNKLGFIFQFFNLLSTLSVQENIALPLELANQSPQQIGNAVQKILERVQLSHRASFYPAQLSGGEMQRTAIARALIHRPAIVIADEPTGNLDTENGHNILSMLKALTQENGQTVIMATHSEEAAQFADRVIRMRDGQIQSEHSNL